MTTQDSEMMMWPTTLRDCGPRWVAVPSGGTGRADRQIVSTCVVAESPRGTRQRQRRPGRTQMTLGESAHKCGILQHSDDVGVFTLRLLVELSIFTSGAKGRLFGPWGGAHCSSGAAETAGRSGRRTVSARLTGHLARWSDRTAVAGGTEVTMGTVGGSGSGAAAQTHVSGDMKQQRHRFESQTLPQAVGAEGKQAVSEVDEKQVGGGKHAVKLESLSTLMSIASLP